MTTDEIIALLQRMDSGELDFWCDQIGWEIYAGDVTFVAADGHRVVVFNDCDEWDYVDSIYTPDGTMVWKFSVDVPYDEEGPVANWQPAHMERWENARVVPREVVPP